MNEFNLYKVYNTYTVFGDELYTYVCLADNEAEAIELHSECRKECYPEHLRAVCIGKVTTQYNYPQVLCEE